MSCEQMLLVQRLVVESCEALESDEWQEHFDACEECRLEWDAYSRSLAIFSQLEWERISRFKVAAGWEEFSERLTSDWRRWQFLRKMRLPAAAAMAGALVVGGASWWITGNVQEPSSKVAAENRSQPSSSSISSVPQSIPNTISRPLNYVSTRHPGRQGAPLNRETYVFEFRDGEVKIGVVERNGGGTKVSDDSSKSRYVIGIPAAGNSWNPPNATRNPVKTTRVDFSVGGDLAP